VDRKAGGMSGFTTTPNYALKKPTTGADDDIWGDHLNQNADTLDTIIKNTNNQLANFVLKAGDVMSGALSLNADPTLPQHASTKRYTDTMLPLAGGTLTGPLTDAGGDSFGAADPRLGTLAYFWQDPTQQVAGGIGVDGTWRWGQAQINALAATAATLATATIQGGTATLATLNATTSITTPSGIIQVATVAGDNWAALDPRYAGLQYGWTDPTGAVAGGITADGTLAWSQFRANSGAIAGTLNVGSLNFSGALTVPTLTVNDIIFGPLDPRYAGLQYAWTDPTGAIAAGVGTDGTVQISSASVQTSLTLGFDATAGNHALRKSAADALYIARTGGTMSGPLYLPAGAPTVGNQAANKDYVDHATGSGGGGGGGTYPIPPLRDPVQGYGAVGDGVADDSTPLNNCIAAAQAAGERMIAINKVYNCPTLGVAAANIVMIGNGTLRNNKVWRWPIPPFAPTPPRSVQRTLVARKHCPQFTTACRAGSAVVVMTGDSVASPDSNGFTSSAMLYVRVKRAIHDQNPGVNISYYNRAIGGQRWSNLDTVPTSPNAGSWYTDPLRAWLLYIQDLNPDLVIINFASNDGWAFRLQIMLSVLNKIRAWTKVPDIVLATSNSGPQYQLPAGSQPSPEANADFNMGAHAYAASFERSYALAHNMGLIDTFRFTNMHKFGWDPEDLPLVRDFSVTGTTTSRLTVPLPYTWPVKCHGYGGRFYIGTNGWAGLGGEIQFQLGNTFVPNNNGGVFRVGRDSATGNIYYQVDTTRTAAGADQDDILVPKTVVSNWPAGTGQMEFEWSVTGSNVAFKANTGINNAVDPWIMPFHGSVPRFAAPWQPTITCTAGSVTSNYFYFDRAGDGYACAVTANPHPRAMYQQTLTDSEAHGTGSAPPDIWGGGGGAHNSTLLALYACQAAIDSCDFSTGA